jgi:hypothetical protein
MIPPFSRANLKALPSICILIACLTLTCWTTGARAQGFDATTLRQPTNPEGGWLVHGGDDPAYARPELDDSRWIQFNASSDSLRTKLPNSQPEVVWYRLHVKLAPDEHNLSLHTTAMPGPWEIYVNGARLAKACSFSPHIACASDGHMVIPIPDKLLAGGSLVIALRIYISRVAWNSSPRPGFMSYQLTFGQQEGMREHMWYWMVGGSVMDWLDDLIGWGIMLGALLLYSTQRKRPEYLWLFLWLAVEIPYILLALYGLFHTFPLYWYVVVNGPGILWPYFMARTFCAFASHRIGWKLNLFLVLTFLSLAFNLGSTFFPVQSLYFELFYYVPISLLGLVVLPWILIADIRRGRRETAFLLVPLLLRSLWFAGVAVGYILLQFPGLRDKAYAFLGHWIYAQFGGLFIPFGDVANLLSMFSLALIVLIRSNRTSRQQALLEAEMANAREVQQVILPEAMDTIPGFHIESVYEPAREVGGDFFQVLPAPDNGLILVIGDVAGKGLPAAMLVSVLVGAARTAAQYDPSPAAILGQLNAHLVGRTNGGFCTALAAHITADGVVSIANAGHLPPYLDGKEMELPGALPLGIVSGISYDVTRIDLGPGGRLTFYSDGVVEAQDKRGQLFGFERAREFSIQPAAAIAEAAKAFGQQDDITVITVGLAAAETRREVKLSTTRWATA